MKLFPRRFGQLGNILYAISMTSSDFITYRLPFKVLANTREVDDNWKVKLHRILFLELGRQM